MLEFDFTTGRLSDPQTGLIYADRPYHFSITAHPLDGVPVTETGLTHQTITTAPEGLTLTGQFEQTGIGVTLVFQQTAAGLQETLSIKNLGDSPLSIDHFAAGWCADLSTRPVWRLCAIPFRVQLDGSRHDYPVPALIAGQFSNAVFEDTTRQYMPPLTEAGRLRSEAWAWGTGDRGLVIIKYNPRDIELSIAAPLTGGGETNLRFGGAGFCLYGEPARARTLAPGQEFTFGTTTYLPYEGGLTRAFTTYRDFLDARGHTFPADYNPPVNWNELYDVGWYHSRPADLTAFYTRGALLNEAAKARAVGCELLYLDPGWEVCEGTTLWDETRLGTVASMVSTLKNDYGLDLAFRTVLRTYTDHWPHDWLIRHADGESRPVLLGDQYFWEPCLVSPAFWNEKLRRILAIATQGVRFIMVDEFDWRGPCLDPTHGHPVPTTPLDHCLAVYRLCCEIRQACPGLTIETHDPVWPWSTSIYVPTYFQHGFGDQGSYDENWGFEYMWDCLNDLKSGRALALYDYNLSCNVPLYLHITMSADNDACVFFWWVASTVRHLGIGGKDSNKTIEPPEGLPPRDAEQRFAAYRDQMAVYRALKPYFVRGTFHGIAETAHLHTLPGKPGGVLNLFNLIETAQDLELFISRETLQSAENLPVLGAAAAWEPGGVRLRRKLRGMSPAVVCIGDAVGDLTKA
jgi:hypothetical protein